MEFGKFRKLQEVIQGIHLKRNSDDPISDIVTTLDQLQIKVPEERGNPWTWVVKPEVSDLNNLSERSRLFLQLDEDGYQDLELTIQRVEWGIAHVSLQRNGKSVDFLVDKTAKIIVNFSRVNYDGEWFFRDIGLENEGLDDLSKLTGIVSKLTRQS